MLCAFQLQTPLYHIYFCTIINSAIKSNVNIHPGSLHFHVMTVEIRMPQNAMSQTNHKKTIQLRQGESVLSFIYSPPLFSA